MKRWPIEAGTRCCVVHIAAQEDECEQWNRERLKVWHRENEAHEEAEPQHKTNNGNGYLGDLVPESHTAIYGDRVVEKQSRSRSSSLGGLSGGEEARNGDAQDETMTLKSLYIYDKPDAASKAVKSNHSTQTAPPVSKQPSKSTPSTPPPPTSCPPYSPTTLSSLMMRYEPPSPFSRWDTPLFTIPSADVHPPYSEIYLAIYPPPTKPTSRKALSQVHHSTAAQQSQDHEPNVQSGSNQVKQHAATVLPKATSSDALQILESTTQLLVKTLLSRARELGIADTGEGGTVSFFIPLTSSRAALSNQTEEKDEQKPEEEQQQSQASDTIEATLSVPTGTVLSQPMLQRLRRKYTQIQRGGIAHGQDYVRGRRAVVEGFVGFLDAELNLQGLA